MSPELEILDYLAGSDESLEVLLHACPDVPRLVGCIARMFDAGRIWIRIDERPVRAFEVQAWLRTPPDAEARKRILVGLAQRDGGEIAR